jgi:hypothetical protein
VWDRPETYAGYVCPEYGYATGNPLAASDAVAADAPDPADAPGPAKAGGGPAPSAKRSRKS